MSELEPNQYDDLSYQEVCKLDRRYDQKINKLYMKSGELESNRSDREHDILQYLLENNPQVDFDHINQYTLISKKKMNDFKQRIRAKEGR